MRLACALLRLPGTHHKLVGRLVELLLALLFRPQCFLDQLLRFMGMIAFRGMCLPRLCQCHVRICGATLCGLRTLIISETLCNRLRSGVTPDAYLLHRYWVGFLWDGKRNEMVKDESSGEGGGTKGTEAVRCAISP